MVLRRRRHLHAGRGTQALATSALVATAAVAVTEWLRLRARHPEEQPAETLREAVDIVAAGYRTGTARENALFNLLSTFSLTFIAARLSTWSIRRRGTAGPFRNLRVKDRHVHHFIPGIVMAFVAGGISVASKNESLDAWLALPFGAGVALTLDESALLLELDDVYWSERGIVSVQITLTAMLMLSGLALGLRLLRRGEAEVL
ncbi:MAG: hypothetical protein E6G41_10655 [Actinobacteria bacterium]|nr:MAG: hypothetical protein E6G41_10655 [Actinomycetota bacterium]